MSLTIMKRIRFCAGHRLYGHGGKCEFFHGHNYVAEFYVRGETTDAVGPAAHRCCDVRGSLQHFGEFV